MFVVNLKKVGDSLETTVIVPVGTAEGLVLSRYSINKPSPQSTDFLNPVPSGKRLSDNVQVSTKLSGSITALKPAENNSVIYLENPSSVVMGI